MDHTNGAVKAAPYPMAGSIRDQIEIMRTMLDEMADLPDAQLERQESLSLVRRSRGFLAETLEYVRKF